MHNKNKTYTEIKIRKIIFLKDKFRLKMFTFSDFLKNRGKSFHKNGAQTLKVRQPYDLVVKRFILSF